MYVSQKVSAELVVEFKTATKSAQQSGAGPSRGRFKEGFPNDVSERYRRAYVKCPVSHSHELIEARRRAGMDQTSFGTHVASKSDENTDAATIQEYAATLEKRVHDKATAEGESAIACLLTCRLYRRLERPDAGR